MSLKKLTLSIGILALIICFATWILDLNHLVIDCIYCRSERTVIGLLGILILLPIYSYITRYLSYVVGFFGASVATQQIMLILTKGAAFSLELPLAIAALLLITGLQFFIFYITNHYHGD